MVGDNGRMVKGWGENDCGQSASVQE